MGLPALAAGRQPTKTLGTPLPSPEQARRPIFNHSISTKKMKLLILFALLTTSAFAGTPWTHKTIEGEGGGTNGDYYFFQSFTPTRGSDVMSVLKARAVYAFDPTSEVILVADYSFSDGLHVRISQALRKDANVLFAGDDVEMKTIREYRIPFEVTRGQMIKPQAGTKLTEPQQADLFNLIHVLAIQRCAPPSSEQTTDAKRE